MFFLCRLKTNHVSEYEHAFNHGPIRMVANSWPRGVRGDSASCKCEDQTNKTHIGNLPKNPRRAFELRVTYSHCQGHI
jgi:hypothetical protein